MVPRLVFLLLALAGCGKAKRIDTPTDDATTGEAQDAAGAVAEDDEDAGDLRAHVWPAWPMPNPPNIGLPQPARYAVSSLGGQEVVNDEVTGLVWQRSVGARGVSQSEARAYCNRLAYGSFADWRLPSRIELVSLIDFTRSMELAMASPAIDPVAFPETAGDWFWTSSLKSGDLASAWYVYFYFGYVDVEPTRNGFNARCVRAAPATPHEGYELQTATVRDRGTGLVWQRTASAEHYNFTAAAAYCAALKLAGADDWRVPTMKELQTIVDEGLDAPAQSATTFPDAAAEAFWSSSLWAASENQAWFVEFTHGSGVYGLTTMAYRVRCVR